MAPLAKLSPSHQKILNVAAVLSEGKREEGVSRKQVMVMSGYEPTNKGFVVALSTLKNKKKCLTYDADTITLNHLGWSLAEPAENVQLPSNEGHWDKIRSLLKGNKAKLVFDFLVTDGQMHTREEVAIAIGYDTAKCSAFSVTISQLASKKFMEYCQNDTGEPCLVLTDLVYPFGRP